MLAIPEIKDVDLAFGNIEHMPRYETLPAEFRDWHNHPSCEAISHWFMRGASQDESGILIGKTKYMPKEGVDNVAALRAIKAVLASWSPKHEHKIAACGYMLHEWFDATPINEKARA